MTQISLQGLARHHLGHKNLSISLCVSCMFDTVPNPYLNLTKCKHFYQCVLGSNFKLSSNIVGGCKNVSLCMTLDYIYNIM